MRLALATTLLLLLLAAAAPAQALELDAKLGPTGWIALEVRGTPGSRVTVTEGGTTVREVTLKGDRTTVRKAVPWSCDRALRSLAATDGTETAAAQVRTPTCRKRVALAVRPFSPRRGRRLLVRVRDHWRLGGFETKVCLAGACRTAKLKSGRATVNVRLRARRRGIRAVTAVTPWGRRVKRVVEVRTRPLTLLATGDSMIQLVDHRLKERLKPRGVRVQSDARISTGISKPAMLDWVALARRQAQARRPTVTVMFIGANDGFPIAGVPCCGPEWIKGYAARVRRMMGSYRRRGAARIYWLTLPAPRKANFARVFRAVNAALRLAEPALAGGGRIIDTGRVFTPGGRFRSTVGGRVVRQPDGVHLNVRGASIAAGLVIRELRRDGVLAG